MVIPEPAVIMAFVGLVFLHVLSKTDERYSIRTNMEIQWFLYLALSIFTPKWSVPTYLLCRLALSIGMVLHWNPKSYPKEIGIQIDIQLFGAFQNFGGIL